MQVIRTLNKDCKFQQVTAVQQHQNEYIRNVFIRGRRSSWMRKCLYENKTFGLEELFNQVCTLEAAARSAESEKHVSQSPVVKVLKSKY